MKKLEIMKTKEFATLLNNVEKILIPKITENKCVTVPSLCALKEINKILEMDWISAESLIKKLTVFETELLKEIDDVTIGWNTIESIFQKKFNKFKKEIENQKVYK